MPVFKRGYVFRLFQNVLRDAESPWQAVSRKFEKFIFVRHETRKARIRKDNPVCIGHAEQDFFFSRKLFNEWQHRTVGTALGYIKNIQIIGYRIKPPHLHARYRAVAKCGNP